MKCKNCQIELKLIKGKEPKVFCSDKCRKAYNRKLVTSDKLTSDIIKQPTSDNYINRWGKDVRDMNTETLYFYIRFYEHDTWKDSPEFKELEKRLNAKPLKNLKAQNYWIPNRLLK